MSQNLRHQLRKVIFQSFQEHLDKHALKADGLGDDKVFSYTTRNHLLDFVNNFCGNTEGLPRNVKNLTKNHTLSFMEAKAEAGCSQRSLNTYRTDFIKIGKLIKMDIDPGKVQAKITKDTHRGVKDIISHDDLAKIIVYAREHPSRSGEYIRLEAEIGVRVSDIAYGVWVHEKELRIKSKNGKVAVREITPRIREILDSPVMKDMIREDGKVVGPKDGSINKYLARVEDKLGLERHSFHSIRRRIARDVYNRARMDGKSVEEAKEKTSLHLNHGKHRDRLLETSYVNTY